MRRVVVALCASLLIVGLAAAPVTAGGPSSDPFTGAWKGMEGELPITLAISGGGQVRHITFADFCNACNPPGFLSVGLGRGTVSGNTLVAVVRWHDGGWSDDGPQWSAPFALTITATAAGTLKVFGITMYRAGDRP